MRRSAASNEVSTASNEVSAADSMQRAATPTVTSNDDDELDSLVESVRSAAIDGLLRSIHLDRQRKCNDFEAYLTRLRSRIIREVNQQLRQLNSIKVQVKIVAEYEKPPVVQQSGGALQRARRAAKTSQVRGEGERQERRDDWPDDEAYTDY